MTTPITAFYETSLTLPAVRFGYVLAERSVFYDALALGVPFDPFGTFALARLSSTSWRVTFAKPVRDYPPMRLRECYVFSPALTVHSVTPSVNGGTGHITSVDIVTSEQGPTTYTLTIYGTEVVP